MIRAPFGNKKYWEEQYNFFEECKNENLLLLEKPSKNPNYVPEFTFSFVRLYLEIILTLYSKGDLLESMKEYFEGLLDAWELSNKLAQELNETLKEGEGWDHRHLLMSPQISSDSRAHTDPRAWVFKLSNLNHYNFCFWLISLAILLDIEEILWQRLLKLINKEGEDKLLDMIIATREKDRKIGNEILHPKPYKRLLKAIESPKEKQAKLLLEFVKNWYKELKRKEDEEIWWYFTDVPMKEMLEKGNYFGYWCIEAAVCTKVFNIDDSLCLENENYPKAFLHKEEKESFLKKLFKI